MKNHKQLLADFYLALLAIPEYSKFRATDQPLYIVVREALVNELNSDSETVQRIFERMVKEDK